MTKIFTAVAVLQLAQRGKLDIFDPLIRFVPDYPDKEAATRVTMHHLLTHTSGVNAEVSLFQETRRRARSLEDLMFALGPLGLEFEPGSRWAYTNYGYLLLGLVVQRVANQAYNEFIREHIFEPAGMEHSSFEPDDTRDAIGYMRTSAQAKWQRDASPPATAPALPSGGSFSPVEDIKRFADALLDHRLLDPSHAEMLSAGKVDAGTLGGREAYGGEVFEVDGIRWFGRSGSGTSGNGELRIYPESGYVVVVLSNLTAPAAIHMAAFVGDRLPAR